MYTPFGVLQLGFNFLNNICINQRQISVEFHPNNGRKEWHKRM